MFGKVACVIGGKTIGLAKYRCTPSRRLLAVDSRPPRDPSDPAPTSRSKPSSSASQSASRPPAEQCGPQAIASKPPAEKVAPNPTTDQCGPKPPVNQCGSKPPVDQKAPKPPADKCAPKPTVDQCALKPPADKCTPKPPADKCTPKPPADKCTPKPPDDKCVPKFASEPKPSFDPNKPVCVTPPSPLQPCHPCLPTAAPPQSICPPVQPPCPPEPVCPPPRQHRLAQGLLRLLGLTAKAGVVFGLATLSNEQGLWGDHEDIVRLYGRGARSVGISPEVPAMHDLTYALGTLWNKGVALAFDAILFIPRLFMDYVEAPIVMPTEEEVMRQSKCS